MGDVYQYLCQVDCLLLDVDKLMAINNKIVGMLDAQTIKLIYIHVVSKGAGEGNTGCFSDRRRRSFHKCLKQPPP